MKKTIAGVALSAMVLTVAGCGGADAPSAAPTVTVTSTVTVTAEPELHYEDEPLAEETLPEEETATEEVSAVEETEAAQDSTSGVAAFGESVTLADNEGTITISAPAPFTPSDTASLTGEWDEIVVMDVVETNDGSEPTMAGWVISATTGSQEAERIYDSAQGVNSPTVDVMPGKSIEYKIAFGRNTGEDFVVKAGPLMGSNDTYFQ